MNRLMCVGVYLFFSAAAYAGSEGNIVEYVVDDASRLVCEAEEPDGSSSRIFLKVGDETVAILTEANQGTALMSLQSRLTECENFVIMATANRKVRIDYADLSIAHRLMQINSAGVTCTAQ